MKAVLWHDVGKVSLEEVPELEIRDPADAIVRITTSAICGTDLHFVRGHAEPLHWRGLLAGESVPVPGAC